MRADNSKHLQVAAASRQAQTRRRAFETLARVASDNQSVTVAGFARQAGVSRAWVYSQPEVLAQLKEVTEARPTSSSMGQPASDASLRRRLEVAHARNKALEIQVRELRTELSVLLGERRRLPLNKQPKAMKE